MVYDLPRDTAPHSFGAHDSSSRKNVDWKELQYNIIHSLRINKGSFTALLRHGHY